MKKKETPERELETSECRIWSGAIFLLLLYAISFLICSCSLVVVAVWQNDEDSQRAALFIKPRQPLEKERKKKEIRKM